MDKGVEKRDEETTGYECRIDKPSDGNAEKVHGIYCNSSV